MNIIKTTNKFFNYIFLRLRKTSLGKIPLFIIWKIRLAIKGKYNAATLDFLCANIDDFYNYLKKYKLGGQKALIIFDHSLGGGANIWADELVKKQKTNYIICLLRYFPAFDSYSLTLYANNHVKVFGINIRDDLSELFTSLETTEIIVSELVSYPNTLKILQEIAHLKDTYKYKITFYVHDYYCICPNFILLDATIKYCNIPNIEKCSDCIKQVKLNDNPLLHTILFANDFTTMQDWRNNWKEFFNDCADEIVCFSESSKKTLLKAYPNIDIKKIAVVPHQVNYISPLSFELLEYGNSEKICIGILGNIFHECKGAKILYEMAEEIKQKKINVKLVVIGTLNHKYAHNNIHVHGTYKKLELPGLIKKYHVNIIFIPSVCPETFSYVTEESMMISLPVAVFNIGAPAERVAKYDRGLVIDKIDAIYALNNILEFVTKLRDL